MTRTLAPLATALTVLFALAACSIPGADAPAPATTDAAASDAASPSPEPEPEPAPAPTFNDTDRTNVIAAVESGNTAAIEGHLSDPVTVIMAASECCGPLAPAEAIQNLDYVSGAASPWDFNLDVATIASYQAGWYSDYFPDGALVGRSADGWVISFAIDGDDITGIFMSAGEELLL